MAISARAAGTWAESNATTQTVAIPADQVTGDMMLCLWSLKPFDATPTIDQSWSTLGSYANGVVTAGNGTGSMLTGIFYKIATSDTETDPTITWGTTSVPGAAVIVVFQKGAGESWFTPVGTSGGVTVQTTSYSATMSSNPGITAGDMCVAVTGVRDDTVMTVPTFTATSVTFATVVEYPGTAHTSTTSNDMSADACYRLASSGTASAAPVVTHTFDSNETGSTFFARLRVGVFTNANAGVAAATAASYADTGKVEARGTGAATPAPAAYAAIPKLGMSSTGVAPATAAGYDIDAKVSPTGGVGAVTAAGAGVTSKVVGTTGAAASTAEGYGNGPGVGATASVAEILAAALAATAETGGGGITFDADVAAAVCAALAGNGTLSTNAGLARVRTA